MTTVILAAVSLCLASMAHAQASAVTTGAEQRALIEALSGAAQTGVGGLPSIISQRFSDSPEIHTTAQFVKAKYDAAGIPAQILEYDPMEAFPYYFKNTDDTYRSYFRHMMPMLQADFDGLCAGTLPPDRVEVVVRRLNRVGLEREAFCRVKAKDRVETYISTTVAHTTAITRKMLDERRLATWPNVIAYVSTAETQGEAGPRPLCVIGAHMDSVARDGGGRGPIISPATLAPGADDNGSGTAAIITLARALREWVQKDSPDLKCDFAFVHFSGEEEGLLGSLAYTHLQLKRPVLWMVNFDMIAFNSEKAPAPAMNVGYDKRFGSDLAQQFAGDVENLRTIVVERDAFIYSSDQISFWEIGVPAISISEQACSEATCKESFKYFNPTLHTPDDTVKILDFDYAARIINKCADGLKKLATYKLR